MKEKRHFVNYYIYLTIPGLYLLSTVSGIIMAELADKI